MNFSIQLLYSSAPEFLLVLFSIFSLLIFSFYLYVVFWAQWASLCQFTMKFLLDNSYTSVSLGSVSGDLFCCFSWAVFPCFFLCVLLLCFGIFHLKTQPHRSVFKNCLHAEEDLYRWSQICWGLLKSLLWTCGYIFPTREVLQVSFFFLIVSLYIAINF